VNAADLQRDINELVDFSLSPEAAWIDKFEAASVQAIAGAPFCIGGMALVSAAVLTLKHRDAKLHMPSCRRVCQPKPVDAATK
jgi:hypothetical protein